MREALVKVHLILLEARTLLLQIEFVIQIVEKCPEVEGVESTLVFFRNEDREGRFFLTQIRPGVVS